MGRIIDGIVSILMWIPRAVFRKLVVEEHARDAQRTDLREIRDALIAAQEIVTMETGFTPAWFATRQACVKALGLATAAGDEVLRDEVRNYHAAHDAIATNWTRDTAQARKDLRTAFDGSLGRIAALLSAAGDPPKNHRP
jgi:hypothetical protein